MSLDGSQDHFDYNDRYGIKKVRAWVPYAVICALLGFGWIAWAGLHHANPTVSSELIAFNNQDPRNVEIRYILNREDPSQQATCILVARDIDKVIVGQIIDHIPASTSAVERAIHIPTRADAVNAGIQSCYLD